MDPGPRTDGPSVGRSVARKPVRYCLLMNATPDPSRNARSPRSSCARAAATRSLLALIVMLCLAAVIPGCGPKAGDLLEESHTAYDAGQYTTSLDRALEAQKA